MAAERAPHGGKGARLGGRVSSPRRQGERRAVAVIAPRGGRDSSMQRPGELRHPGATARRRERDARRLGELCAAAEERRAGGAMAGERDICVHGSLLSPIGFGLFSLFSIQ